MKHRHFKINKPFGVLSQFTYDHVKKNKRLLGEFYDFPNGTMAIGRLDEPSEGLLLLTTDGKVSNELRSSKFEKEYWAQVDGIPDLAVLDALNSGVAIAIEGKIYTTAPCEVEAIEEPALPPRPKKIRGDHHGPTSWLKIVLREGRFRQVRKMTAAVGHATLRLVRVRVGDITLDDLQPGQVVELEKLI